MVRQPWNIQDHRCVSAHLILAQLRNSSSLVTESLQPSPWSVHEHALVASGETRLSNHSIEANTTRSTLAVVGEKRVHATLVIKYVAFVNVWLADDSYIHSHSTYVGINLEDILYGVELVLYFQTMHALLRHPGKRTKSDVFYAVFSSVMLLTTTIWVAMQALFGQKMWIPDAQFPNGPDGFWIANITVWYMDVATSSLVTLQLMTDALMIYRCWVVLNNYRTVIIPLILWAVTLVLGVLICWASTVSGGVLFRGNIVLIGLVYNGISVFLTALLTWMICYHLIRHGGLMKDHLGSEYASMYFAVAVIVESVLPYTLSSIAFLISLGLGSQMEPPFGHVHALIMCISPQMLILRVATKASTRDTGAKQPPSTIKFSPLDSTMTGMVPRGSEELFSQAIGSSCKGSDDMV